MKAFSQAAGTVARAFAARVTRSVPSNDFYVRVLSESPMPELVSPEEGAPPASRSSGMGCRVIGTATAKKGFFAITVNGCDTIGVIVGVDLERGAPGWPVFAGTVA